VQARRRGTGPVEEEALASIAGYYARVTTRARPMNRLVASAMLATLAAIVVEIASGDVPAWVAWCSLALAGAALGLAGARTVPAAVRLGSRADDAARQSELARAILGEHVICFASIGSLLVLQLAFA